MVPSMTILSFPLSRAGYLYVHGSRLRWRNVRMWQGFDDSYIDMAYAFVCLLVL